MAALEQIAESLSTQGVLDAEECVSRATATATGTFCMGFSAGVAAQVHYSRYIPKSVRATMLVPLVVGATAAATVYEHGITECGKRWNSAQQTGDLITRVTPPL